MYSIVYTVQFAVHCAVYCTLSLWVLRRLCTLWIVHCLQCVLYTVYTIYTVNCKLCTLYTLWAIQKWWWLCSLCKTYIRVECWEPALGSGQPNACLEPRIGQVGIHQYRDKYVVIELRINIFSKIKKTLYFLGRK